MLSEFEEKAKEVVQKYQQEGLICDFQIVQSPTGIDKSSVRLDIDTGQYLGRIVCWETGEIQIEILSIDTEKTVLDEYRELSHSQDIASVLLYYFERLL